MSVVRSVSWIARTKHGLVPGFVRILDQTKLPGQVKYIDTTNLKDVWTAIKNLQVRGAPAIGVAAAMGIAASVQKSAKRTAKDLVDEVNAAGSCLATSRPTAVNLFWAIDRMKRVAADNGHLSVSRLKERLAQEAVAIRNEDAAMCLAIGRHGNSLLRSGFTILTHCNAGGLATSEYGTALAPVYFASQNGKKIKVFADETRPLLQGARLTVWELMQAGIDTTLICDNMAAQVMKEGRIDAVLVGADRIAANGDAANKIGTYGVAVLAQAHKIPFYVLAPSSTFDVTIPDGSRIPIEQRGSEEVTNGFGKRTAPHGAKVYSPAFDVTPARLITAIVCEKGIARPDFRKSLKRILTRKCG
ncbi:MAG: S-methyl-5-thioribose-1-phosphate isomerase [Verrucomicrobia bacterium]|nr:S-methyl-5-thioribose-1-phosphate isomerase [Verrucomicrobiota bacterium]